MAAPVAGEHRVFVRTDLRGLACPGAGDLQAYFTLFGSVLDIYKPARSPDVAYVTMSSEIELVAALQDPKPTVAGVVLFLIQASPRGPPPPAAVAAANGGIAGIHHGGAHDHAGASWACGGAPRYAGGQAAFGAPALGAPPAPGAPAGAAAQDGRLYVQGLNDSVQEDMLRTHFSYFGMVKDVYMPLDKATGLRKPFAFVTMTSVEEAATVLAMPPHHLIGSVTVTVTAAAPRDPVDHPGAFAAGPTSAAAGHGGGGGAYVSGAYGGGGACLGLGLGLGGAAPAAPGSGAKQGIPSPWRLFVFGMPQGLNADMLRGHFAYFGDLTDVYVPPSGPDKAYVTYAREEDLQEALLRSGTRIAGFAVQGIKQAEPRSKGGGKGDYRAGPY